MLGTFAVAAAAGSSSGPASRKKNKAKVEGVWTKRQLYGVD